MNQKYEMKIVNKIKNKPIYWIAATDWERGIFSKGKMNRIIRGIGKDKKYRIFYYCWMIVQKYPEARLSRENNRN